MELQHSPALNDGPAVSAAVAADDAHHRDQHSRAARQLCRWSGFHTRVVLALGITWILDGLEVTLAGALSGALKESPTLQFSNFDRRSRQQRLSRRRRARRARLRLAHRPHRPQEAVLHHARALSHRDRRDRAVVECRELRAVSLSHRRRHRRRIHRDQFDDPGTGAGALSRLDRSRHQRQLLDRRGDRRGRRHRAARSRVDRPRSRLAARLSHRRRASASSCCDADVDSGEPALADDPRPPRRGARDRRRDRALGDRA